MDLNDLQSEEELETALDEAAKPPKRYQSKEGFVHLPVYRTNKGLEELLNWVYPLGGCILGGFVRWMCSPREEPVVPGDVDVYSPTEEIFEQTKELMESHFELESVHENDVSLLYRVPRPTLEEDSGELKEDAHPLFPLNKVQLIKPIKEGAIVTKGDMGEILSNFDFTVVRIGLTSTCTALGDADFTHDEMKRIIRIKNIHCPISSTLRYMKYSRKGYFATPFEVMKLFTDWDNRSDDYREELLDFLNKAAEEEGLDKESIEQMERMMRFD